jgi:alkylation response protein AidB-like acyl-CoA dehydrogenase
MEAQLQANTELMDTEEERAFRLEARSYLAGADFPPRLPDEPVYKWDDDGFVARERRIQRALWDGGFAGITLPVAYGGRGLRDRYDEVFVEEARPYRMPWAFGVNRNVVIPPMLSHGSEDLKERFIPAMLRGDHIWCQLLSEPSGGSDLAGLLTRAVRDGDTWVLNGSKIWTTGGNHADYGVCLARTNPEVPKHAGLTMFAVDMKQPGMTVVPLRLADRSAHFCQEYLDDVVVPAADVIGDVNDGWRVATTMLMHERAAVGRGWDYGKERARAVEQLRLSTAAASFAQQAGTAADSHVRQLLGELWVLESVTAGRLRNVIRRPPRPRGCDREAPRREGGRPPDCALLGAGRPPRCRGARQRRRAVGDHRGRPAAGDCPQHRGRHRGDAGKHHRRASPGSAPRAGARPRGPVQPAAAQHHARRRIVGDCRVPAAAGPRRRRWFSSRHRKTSRCFATTLTRMGPSGGHVGCMSRASVVLLLRARALFPPTDLDR